jgi:hypothetical protein
LKTSCVSALAAEIDLPPTQCEVVLWESWSVAAADILADSSQVGGESLGSGAPREKPGALISLFSKMDNAPIPGCGRAVDKWVPLG